MSAKLFVLGGAPLQASGGEMFTTFANEYLLGSAPSAANAPRAERELHLRRRCALKEPLPVLTSCAPAGVLAAVPWSWHAEASGNARTVNPKSAMLRTCENANPRISPGNTQAFRYSIDDTPSCINRRTSTRPARPEDPRPACVSFARGDVPKEERNCVSNVD